MQGKRFTNKELFCSVRIRIRTSQHCSASFIYLWEGALGEDNKETGLEGGETRGGVSMTCSGSRSSGPLESNLRTTTHVKRGDFLTDLATGTVADDNKLTADFRHSWIECWERS